ncbi:amino acid permease [Spirochaetia bacterium]|nr:amino acid permease [Spirochaetia bacterium]
MENQILKRTFGMREAVTITVGNVVGVGLFTVGANVVGIMGSTVILATFVAMLVSIYPAMLYAEMGAALPYAGGTYKYASLGLGKPLGMLAGWSYVISLVAVTSGESLAFSFYFKTMFRAFGIEIPISDLVIACVVVIAFMVTNILGVQMTGRLQNGFMFFFWGVAIIWFIMMIPNVHLPYFAKLPEGLSFAPGNFITYVALIWWCFAGFETCCAMGEEIKYPHINIPRALFLSPLIIFAVNAIFQWFLIGIVPTGHLGVIAEAAAPYADGMAAAGILGFPLCMLAAGIAFGGDFSTLNSTIAVPPRYLFTMARDGVMPRIFAKLHPKFKTPFIAIILLGLLSIILNLTNIIYIASLSLFVGLFYYIIGILSSLGLRFRQPNLRRTYKAPGIMIGAPVSVIIYIIMMTQLDKVAFVTGIIWNVLGLVIYFVCQAIHKKAGDEDISALVLNIEEPSGDEKARMDKEYKVWRGVVVTAVIIAIVLHLVVPNIVK